jgi:GGDEF domain-containing protein
VSRIAQPAAGSAAVSSGPVLAVVVASLAVAMVGALALAVLRRRRRRAAEADRFDALTSDAVALPSPVLPSSVVMPADDDRSEPALVPGTAEEPGERALTVLPGRPMPAVVKSASDGALLDPEPMEPMEPIEVIEPTVPEPTTAAAPPILPVPGPSAGPRPPVLRKPPVLSVPASVEPAARERQGRPEERDVPGESVRFAEPAALRPEPAPALAGAPTEVSELPDLADVSAARTVLPRPTSRVRSAVLAKVGAKAKAATKECRTTSEPPDPRLGPDLPAPRPRTPVDGPTVDAVPPVVGPPVVGPPVVGPPVVGPPVVGPPVERPTGDEHAVEGKPAVEEKAATPRRRGATKRQQARLAELGGSLTSVTGRIQLAEVATMEALDLVGADTAALVVHAIQGARVLAASPREAGVPEVWGVRTLVALLSRSEAVRLVLDGDPLAGGGRTALLTVPVPVGGRSAGVLVCRRRGSKGFTVSDEDALSRLARICGDRLHRTPERVAFAANTVDRATGLAGPDLLRHDLADALRTRPEHELPISLIVAEVVGLARLRTVQGMAAADAALADVARQVDAELRVGDLLYRHSADELAVLLPATDTDAAEAVAQRLPGVAPEGARQVSGDAVPPRPGRPEISLRVAAVPVEGEVEGVLLDVARRLKELQVAERWSEPDPRPGLDAGPDAGPEVIQRSTTR